MNLFGNDKEKLKLFNEIYHKYKTIINYWITTRVKNKTYCDDIFQEVMLKIYSHVSNYDISKGNIKNWVYKITMSCINDYFKTYINKEGINYIEDLYEIKDESYEENSKIRDLKHILSDLEYDFFVCYYIMGMTKKNISKMFDIPYYKCKIMIADIYRKLKEYFKEK